MKHTELVKEIARRGGFRQADTKKVFALLKDIVEENGINGEDTKINGVVEIKATVLEAGDVSAFGETTYQPKRVVVKGKISGAMKKRVREKSIERLAE